MPIFTGCGTAIVTPFDSKGAFNQAEYERLINFQIENGADAIVSCGTTGESSTLSLEEHVEVVRSAAETAKKAGAKVGRKVPVIAGAGGNDTMDCCELGNACHKAGADALMYVAPYYNKPSQRGLIAHYTKIASEVDLPIVVYNIPGRSVINIQAKTMEQIAKLPNIVAIKEASGDFGQVAEIAERCGGNLDIYSGNDDYILPVLSLGGIGVISTIGNIAPQAVHDMVEKFLAGEIAESRKLQLSILALVRLLFSDVNPVPVKAALDLMGYETGGCRLPLAPIEDELREKLKAEMKNFGLI
ncbi:MAG: 4-hydroxy-tetrahydrodipicolinate synthase [Defluviitaleaceae bacterium]|nr:4-hydroxy-tetrahydrodipicolinate synthase [Defluviitaleaceae bacterium]MCL2262239.1 4-hydroxy-tetrahydrodipicolinate synthase [Defluviitaleaceae bacterium]